MIKFFRHIRKDLMETGKYLKYAIGEIILVVIGILIALAINNWNEQRKDRDFEVKMLSEMHYALEKDQKHIDNMLNRIKDLDSISNYFMTLSKNKVAYNNSFFSKIFGLNSGTNFQINTGPYQGIKSSGMDKISNDSLRNKLIDFYDFKIPLSKEHFDHVNRNYQNGIDNLLLLLGKRYVENNRGLNYVAWKNTPKNIFQQQKFLEILSDIVWRNISAKRIYIETRNEIKELKQQIELEIKK